MEGWKPLGEMAPQWGLEAPPEPQKAAEVEEIEDKGDLPGPAWEQRKQIGLFSAIAQTIHAVLFRPAETFAKMKHTGGLRSPLLYAVGINAALHAFFVLIPLLGALMMTPQEFQKLWGDFQEPFKQMQAQYPQLLLTLPSVSKSSYEYLLTGSLLLWPFLEVIGYFLGAGLLHLSLMLVGGARRPFETTFRATCYLCGSFNAVAIFVNLIPGGGIGGTILLMALLGYGAWYFYGAMIAFKEAQETQTWRVIVAGTVASLASCCLFMVVGVIMSPLVMAMTGMTEKMPIH
jgi:hypothetical protein